MSAMTSQITCVTVCSTVCSGVDQRKHQSPVLLAFVRGIHWWSDSPHKGPVTWKMFPFDDVIMGPISLHIVCSPLNLMVIIFSQHWIPSNLITSFAHHNNSVVAIWAKFGSDHAVIIWMTAMWVIKLIYLWARNQWWNGSQNIKEIVDTNSFRQWVPDQVSADVDSQDQMIIFSVSDGH